MFDSLWKKTSSIIFARDNYKCRLILLLSKFELEELTNNALYLINIIDPAHILRKSCFPQLKYETSNIVTLNRYSHSQLDQYRNPFNGDYIGKENTLLFWKKILGYKQLEQLKQVLKKLQIKSVLE